MTPLHSSWCKSYDDQRLSTVEPSPRFVNVFLKTFSPNIMVGIMFPLYGSIEKVLIVDEIVRNYYP